MGKSFVYNTGSSDDDKKEDELRFQFGVFIDGTLNNKTNTEMRRKYRKEDKNSIINKGSEKDKKDLEREAIDYKKLKDNDFKLAPQGTAMREYQEYLIGVHRDKLDKQGTDNSYSNDYTNVARMWDCCKSSYAIYVEGMGTGDLQYDSQDGFAFGSGLTGIRNRVRIACQRIVEKIQAEKILKKNENSIITEITLDVFGFSRGAASARDFANEVLKKEYGVKEIEIPYLKDVYIEKKTTYEYGVKSESGGYFVARKSMRKAMGDADGLEIDTSLLIDGKMPKMGHLGYCLLKEKIIKKEQLKDISLVIRFIGVYDTVSSYYEVGALGSYKDDGSLEDDGKFKKLLKEAWSTHFNNDEKELNLHLKDANSYQKMVHFTAKDEHRRNFSLTRINQIEGKAIEKNFPGVHCDIGGAYENGEETVDEIGTSLSDHDYKRSVGWGLLSPIIPAVVPMGLVSLKEDLIENNWYKDYELNINLQTGYVPLYSSYYKLTGKKKMVKKEYSYIPLHFMEDFARTTGMDPYFKDQIVLKYPITNDEFLVRVKKHLHNYVFEDGKEWDFKSDKQLEEERIEREKKEKLDAESKRNAEKFDPNKEVKEGMKTVKDNFDSRNYHNIIIREVPSRKEIKPKIKEPEPIVLQEVVVVGFNSQKALRKLRHEYCHWSANRDWFGMEPNNDRKRRFFPKNK